MTSIEHDSTNNPDAFTTKVELHNNMKALVKECILNNTDVRIETNDAEFKYEPKGPPLKPCLPPRPAMNKPTIWYNLTGLSDVAGEE